MSEYRDLLEELRQKSEEAYDKTVLTLASGALGLSIAFLDKIVPPGEAAYRWLLYLSWSFWVLALLLAVASFALSSLSMSRAIDEYDARSDSAAADASSNGHHPTAGSWSSARINTITISASFFAGIFLLLGVCTMVLFAIMNVERSYAMADKLVPGGTSREKLEKGYSLPKERPARDPITNQPAKQPAVPQPRPSPEQPRNPDDKPPSPPDSRGE